MGKSDSTAHLTSCSPPEIQNGKGYVSGWRNKPVFFFCISEIYCPKITFRRHLEQ